ncbi:MAG: HAMP domain-containing sensor histidine kinase [Polyangiaceae bacterium]
MNFGAAPAERKIEPGLIHESAEDLYENAPCGYLSALLDGCILRVNRTLLGWLGFRREELVGEVPFSSLLTVPSKVFYEMQHAPLLILQGSVKEVALDMVRKDGSRLPVLVSSLLRRDGRGRPLLHRTTVFNATDRRAYEREILASQQKAEHAARSLRHYIAMLGHDIRNPLTSILLAASGLRRMAGSPDEATLTEIVESSATGALRLVNDILTYSQLESGSVALEERQFDVRQTIRGVTQVFELPATQKDVTLSVHVGAMVPSMLLGDPVKLGQVLANLVGNAVKFTRRGSVSVDVDVVDRPGETATLEWRVSDTGIGIDRSKLGLIFEDFTQANEDIGKTFGGAGLGLGICRRILALHGSEMHVDSAPGKGSTFWFRVTLPVAEE